MLTVEECWKFFSSPSNLQKITPETMGFQITDFDSKPMYAGQIIQ
jgi:ligand-binding SRPBCC domain-containing protein